MAAAPQPGLHLTHKAPSPREAQDALTPAGASRELTAPATAQPQSCSPSAHLSKDPHRACFHGWFAEQNRPIFLLEHCGLCSRNFWEWTPPFPGPPNVQALQARARDAARLGRQAPTGLHPAVGDGGLSLALAQEAGTCGLWFQGRAVPSPLRTPLREGG